ncbi:MAG TPA: basic amino acid ABC transporter substrate-binding protein [Solirubrobacterales bacterium]|nr:basic amino acid ABC transporter substrate-binding protein [Solirubrobacterales bacterium]
MRSPRANALLALAAAIVVALFAASCGDDNDDGGGDGAGGTGGGTLSVGSDVPYPPFEQGKAPNYTGFDVELVEAMAEKIGRTARFQDTSFDTIFRDLAQGKFEMVASATTITPEREENVDFTDPYYLSEQALLVKEGSDVKTVEDIEGLTVGVQQGTTGQEFSEEETGAADVRPYPEGPDAVNALVAGTVDAVVIDLPVAEDAVAKQGGVEISTSIPTDEQYGFVVAEGEEELLDELNKALEEIKDDGTYAEIYEKWFKVEPPKQVLDATHEVS